MKQGELLEIGDKDVSNVYQKQGVKPDKIVKMNQVRALKINQRWKSITNQEAFIFEKMIELPMTTMGVCGLLARTAPVPTPLLEQREQ